MPEHRGARLDVQGPPLLAFSLNWSGILLGINAAMSSTEPYAVTQQQNIVSIGCYQRSYLDYPCSDLISEGPGEELVGCRRVRPVQESYHWFSEE